MNETLIYILLSLIPSIIGVIKYIKRIKCGACMIDFLPLSSRSKKAKDHDELHCDVELGMQNTLPVRRWSI
jgi:hypothetical protein